MERHCECVGHNSRDCVGGVIDTVIVNNSTFAGTISGPLSVTNGVIGAGILGGSGAASYGSIVPQTLYAKSIPILLTGTPTDIATIAVPVGITRYHIGFSPISASNCLCCTYSESAVGTLAGANIQFFDSPNGAGNAFTTQQLAPTGANLITSFSTSSPIPVSSAPTIYVRQNSNSVNSGICSFYITIFPIP